jgi:Mor family transcriptional regulator
MTREICSNNDNWSKRLREIAKHIGDVATETLIDLVGGSRIYIPKRISDNHLLSQLGNDAFNFLIEQYGGTYLEIATGSRYKKAKRNQDIVADKMKMTIPELSKKYSLTERQILKILQNYNATTVKGNAVA